MDCRGILGDSKWRLVIIMQTFTLDTAISSNMNASFYADSVNAALWNKARLFFELVVFLLVMYSRRFMKSTRLESFQIDRGIMESEYGSRTKQVLAILERFHLIETGKEQYMARKANFKVVS